MSVRPAVLRLIVLVATASACLVLAAPASAAPGRPTLPVTYDFFAGARDAVARPGASAPGTNDFSCRPTAAHPNPVVLVHGTGGNRQTNWATLGPVLHNAGYCVFALTYGTLPGTPYPINALGGLTSMIPSAKQLGAFIDRVRGATGAAKVDIVGHSEGTLMPEYYVRYLGGSRVVERYVSLAPYWKGQDSSGYLALEKATRAIGLDPKRVLPCPECAEEQYGSPFMRAINAGGSPYDPAVVYTNIMTRDDGVVEPWTDGFVPGPRTTNIVVQDTCAADRSDHLSLVSSPRTAAFVRTALDPRNPVAVPCVPVPPGIPG
ncbi:esterase/lipase family protein [Williamsia phyllosphaerae]|uniref:Lipase n=1 Tax=Williamsia phyllosphaerae TaxID=885042 RepID=A0ABQ1U3X8_9NOCA|nr:lipase [Williamsia phyllosphaerae]GGF08701.1 lipase [Williamsia phyllosphaerae]